jgi:hypothetical protein
MSAELLGVVVERAAADPLLAPAVSKAAWLEAREAANHPDGRVFAPPPATFCRHWFARETDLQECPVLAWDLDSRPVWGLARLREVFGEPTLIVASGGEWANEVTGELQGKVHVYYRLTQPASGEDAILVKNVRRALSKILKTDSSADSVVHPMRWPGSWHTKRSPVMCRIVGGNDRREIDLHEAARKALALLPPPAVQPSRDPPIPLRGGYIGQRSAEARGQGLVRTMLRAPVGQHNSMLHWTLKRVADMRDARDINSAEAESLADAICDAALSIGHPPNRVASTRRSALGAR